MVSPNVDKIFQETQALNDAEREELRSLLTLRASRNQERAKQDRCGKLSSNEGFWKKSLPAARIPNAMPAGNPSP